MAQTFLRFDFGTDEEAAQKARHRLEAWKQAFRLGNKVSFKFERPASEAEGSNSRQGADEKRKAKGDSANKAAESIRLLVRLDFSAHEKNLYQSWLGRIPAEEPFKSAHPETIHRGENEFEEVSEQFLSLT